MLPHLPVQFQLSRLGISRIPQRQSASRVFTLSNFFRQTSFNIPAQIPDVLIGHPKLHTGYNHVVLRIIVSVESLDLFDSLILQKPLDHALINRISCQSVNLPAQNATGLSGLQKLYHPIKNRPSRFFGRFGFFKNFDNFQSLLLGYLLHFNNLGLNGKSLPVLALA
ncbi:MAG: hypothetical protein U5L10_02130 [Candidatus Moranbacteria bacterium]|nr:hypothetical protein [Candidatus Moranbacteria bacterium]